jgi:hypothetical protein
MSEVFWRSWNDIFVRLVTAERKLDPDFAPWVQQLDDLYPRPVMRPVLDETGSVRGGVTVKWINRDSAASAVNYLAGDSIAAGIAGELASGAYKTGGSGESVSWLEALKLDGSPSLWAVAKAAFRYHCLASVGERVFEFSRLKDEDTGELKSFAERVLGEEEDRPPVIEVEGVAGAGDYYRSKSRGAEFDAEMSLRQEGVTASFGGVAGFDDIDLTPDELAADLKLAADKRSAGRARWLAFHKGSTTIWVREQMSKQGFELVPVEGKLAGEWVFVGRARGKEDLGEL